MRFIKPPARDIILELAQHHSFVEAAEILGVDEGTFLKWYHDLMPKSFNRSGPRPVPAPSQEELESVLRTHTNQETADHFNVGYKTLARWIREYGIKDRLFDQEQMLSLADAAREVNVSRMTMSNWFRQGMIPGARKLNGTRVMVPASSIDTLKSSRAGRCRRS